MEYEGSLRCLLWPRPLRNQMSIHFHPIFLIFLLISFSSIHLGFQLTFFFCLPTKSIWVKY